MPDDNDKVFRRLASGWIIQYRPWAICEWRAINKIGPLRVADFFTRQGALFFYLDRAERGLSEIV